MNRHATRAPGSIFRLFRRRALLPGLLFVLLGFAAESAQAQSTFEMTMAPTITCMSLMNIDYLRGWLRQSLNAPYKNEGGADWFNASNKTLFGIPLQDIFISDGSSQYMFIGALFKAPVTKLMAAVDAAGSGNFIAGSEAGQFVSASGAIAMNYGQGTMSKLYCAGMVNTP